MTGFNVDVFAAYYQICFRLIMLRENFVHFGLYSNAFPSSSVARSDNSKDSDVTVLA